MNNNNSNKTLFIIGVVIIIIVVAIFGYRKYKAHKAITEHDVVSGEYFGTFGEDANPYLDDPSIADVKLIYDKKTNNYIIRLKAKKVGETKLHFTETDGKEKTIIFTKTERSIGCGSDPDEILKDYQPIKKDYKKQIK